MGVQRSEYVMVGVFIKELPFSQWDDEYERYICGFADETLWIKSLSGCTDEGYIIGRVMVNGDSYIGIELTSFEVDLPSMRTEVATEIKEKLRMDIAEEEIKLYAFSSWN